MTTVKLSTHAGSDKLIGRAILLTIQYETRRLLDVAVMQRLDDIAAEAQDNGYACALDADWGERHWTHTGEPDARSSVRATGAAVAEHARVTRNPDPSRPRIWRVRVSLLGLRPEIWRRIEMLADIGLAEPHAIVQAAMGWAHTHRYGFGLYGVLDQIDVDCDRASTVRLLDVARPGDTLGYIYDFGDDWHHAIAIEAEIQTATRVDYPRCMAGRNACPLEDCGGPAVRTLAGRMTGEKRALLDGLGSAFDHRSRSDSPTTPRCGLYFPCRVMLPRR